MGAPLNRHHPKRFTSPTWSFNTHTRPPDDTPAEAAEKQKLIQTFLDRKAAISSPARTSSSDRARK